MMKLRFLKFILCCCLGCLFSWECFADEQSTSTKEKNTDFAVADENAAAESAKLGQKNAPTLPKSSLKSGKNIQKKADQTENQKKSSSKTAKTSKKTQESKAIKSSKASKSSKSSKTSKSSKSSKSTFSKDEIARYKAMDFEVWESPTVTSEKGLPIAEGFAQPYPYGNLMRQYNGNKCRHRGLDIGTVGEVNGGMGTVVNSATRAKVTLIGRAGQNTGEFGKLDKRSGIVKRTGKKYPRQILVPGYGLVYPFTRTYGRWRSGMVIVTKVVDGPLKDYTIRYMHLADIRPDLKVGSIVEAGEHIGLMGGSAVMDSWPHVHIDMETPEGRRTDLAPYIGLPDTSKQCTGKEVTKKKSSKQKTSKK